MKISVVKHYYVEWNPSMRMVEILTGGRVIYRYATPPLPTTDLSILGHEPFRAEIVRLFEEHEKC